MTCQRPGCTNPPDQRTRGYCESDYRRTIRMGIHGWRDADQAREHVLALRELGWTWEQIGEAADVSTWTANMLGVGRTRHLLPETHDALLAVPLTPQGSHRGRDNTGARRRVQALSWMGWPTTEVAERVGCPASTLRSLIQPGRRISYALAARVAAVYEELCMRPGPSKGAAGKARGLGFAPPLAWDEDTIDDPNVPPDMGELVSRQAAAAEDAAELLSWGISKDVAADRLGVSSGYVSALLARHRRGVAV